MTIASMTGFAREAGTTGPTHWAWELKSVNGRGLEVRVRVPTGLDSVGEEARALVQKRLGRGTCHLTLTLSRTEAAPRVRINEALLASLAEAVTRVPMPLGITLPSVDGLMGVRGVVEVEEETGDDEEALRRDLAAAALQLVEALAEGRRAEGRARPWGFQRISMSGSERPAASASWTQRGRRPRPDQVWSGFSGLR